MTFSKITYVDNLGSTPAMVNHRTGELLINTPVFNKLNPDTQDFVMYHEEGHLVLNTKDEYLADQYALAKYISTGHPLSSSIMAMTRGFSFKNHDHVRRLKAHMKRVYSYDYNINKNMKANPAKLNNYFAYDGYSSVDGDPMGPPTLEQSMGGDPQASSDPTYQAALQAGNALGIDTDKIKEETLNNVRNLSWKALPPFSGINSLFMAVSDMTGGKKSPWDQMTSPQKDTYTDASLEESFKQSNVATTPKELFAILIAKVGEGDMSKFLADNSSWFPNHIATFEKKYLQKWDQIKPGSFPKTSSGSTVASSPKDKLTSVNDKYNLFNILSVVMVGIALVLIMFTLGRHYGK